MSFTRAPSSYNRAFISVLTPGPPSSSFAVKDMIDVRGARTTAGCEVLARQCQQAHRDAECLLGFRRAGMHLFGKTNLHELAFGTTGINDWTGTPLNPLGADLIPGGSSSGNAVAIAAGLCHFAIGTDTGGSVRIPAACCGTAGLKTTFGCVSTKGVRPLAPSLDVVGPMAKNVAGLVESMELLAGSLEPAIAAKVVYRLEVGDVDPHVSAAVDFALTATELEVLRCPISESEWEDAIAAVNDILWAEAAHSNLDLRSQWSALQNGESLCKGLKIGADANRMHRAATVRARWTERLRELVGQSRVIVSPTIECLPPTFQALANRRIRLARFTSPVNLAGLPALVLPIPTATPLPSSIQLIGPPNGEALLLATAAQIEAAVTHERP